VLEAKIRAEGDVKLKGVRELEASENGRDVIFRQEVIRDTDGRLRVEYTDPPGHRGVLFVSDGVVRWRYYPGERIAFREELPLAAEQKAERIKAMRALRDNLLLALQDGGTVAGRPTWLLTMISRDANAVLRQYWVDRKTLVELKKESYLPGGKPTQREWFVTIDYGPALVGNEFTWHPPRNVRVLELEQPLLELPLQQARQRVEFEIYNPPRTALPPGFELIADKVAVFEEEETKVAWLRFTNGIDILSLFERKRPAFSGPPRHDAVTVEWTAGALHFTLVGRVRPTDANKLRAVTVQALGPGGLAR